MVVKSAHYLQFAVLKSRRKAFSPLFISKCLSPQEGEGEVARPGLEGTHFVSTVLKDFFDGDQFVGANESGLVDDAEGAVANHFGVRVRDLLRFIVAFALGRGHCCHLGRFFG